MWTIVEYQFFASRRWWRSTLITVLFTPLTYVLALGVGLGVVIDRNGQPAVGVPYLVFVAPAFLTASALQIAAQRGVVPGHGRLQVDPDLPRHGRHTDLAAGQICDGTLLFILLRALASSAIYLAIMAAFGGAQRWQVIFAVPVAALTAIGFAGCVAAHLAATVDGESGVFNMLFRFVVTPMFLFSGTFYPISQLPAWGALARLRVPAVARHRARARRRPRAPVAAATGRCTWPTCVVLAGHRCAARPVALRRTDHGMTAVARAQHRAAGSRERVILPPGMYAGRSHVVLERSFRVYKHGWMIIFSGFFEPLFYLFALGTGLHRLVGTVIGPGGHPISYTAFIAPALLASSAMNGAIYDSTMNVFFKLQASRKIYDGMLATSLGPLDVALGEIGWALIRGGLYAAGFMLVMS